MRISADTPQLRDILAYYVTMCQALPDGFIHSDLEFHCHPTTPSLKGAMWVTGPTHELVLRIPREMYLTVGTSKFEESKWYQLYYLLGYDLSPKLLTLYRTYEGAIIPLGDMINHIDSGPRWEMDHTGISYYGAEVAYVGN